MSAPVGIGGQGTERNWRQLQTQQLPASETAAEGRTSGWQGGSWTSWNQVSDPQTASPLQQQEVVAVLDQGSAHVAEGMEEVQMPPISETPQPDQERVDGSEVVPGAEDAEAVPRDERGASEEQEPREPPEQEDVEASLEPRINDEDQALV